MNTEFTYQYPAKGPGEKHHRAILLGTLTVEEKRTIRQICVGNGMTFIPNRVGLPMLAPVEQGKDDTVWHRTADVTLRDVGEELAIDRCGVYSARALYAAFLDIRRGGAWDEKAAELAHGWGPVLVNLESLGKPDDPEDTVEDTGERLTRASHIALITLPNDPEDNMRVGVRQEWVILRALGGHRAAQTLIADHPDLLIPERDADTPLAICIITPSHIEKFDLTTHYKEFQDKQIREAAAEIEAAERQQLQELLAKYPDEITK